MAEIISDPGVAVVDVESGKLQGYIHNRIYTYHGVHYPENDSRSKNTGLFFFGGNEGAKFAVCNAGRGFVYVGAIHDSFPHALELSRRGYNAFALIYRP